MTAGFNSKTLRALVLAAFLVAIANVWMGWRLATLLQEGPIDNLLELEKRIAALPDKAAVKVLVFGNSHAVAGLRPTALAASLGLKPNEIFNLAMPGGSTREMRLLAERFLPLFPSARLAICGVDEYFLSAVTDTRMRYMTRFSIPERLAYARSTPKLDDQIGRVATMALPVADFSVSLRYVFSQHPAVTLQRFFTDVPLPDSFQGRLARVVYPWGYPPPWDDPEIRRLMDRATDAPVEWSPATRAWHLVSGIDNLPDGMSQLDVLARLLEGRGVRLVLAEMPYEQPLMDALRQQASYYNAYKAEWRDYLKATHRHVIPAPTGFTPRCFYDLDHLNPAGATRMAGWLKRQLDEQGWMTMGQGGRL